MAKFFTLENNNCNLTVKNIHCLDLSLTLDCGQSFRWEKNSKGHFCAVVGNKYGELSQTFNADGTTDVTFYHTTVDEFYKFWAPYFDLNRDYDKILDSYRSDPYLSKAIDEFYGIRILNQPAWEMLCSFIISQNNNIPRIKGIIDRLCWGFGDRIRIDNYLDENGKEFEREMYTFPSAEKLAKLEADDLAPLRAGFRNKYIIDAARKVASGEVDLEAIKKLPLCEAEAELIKITGVGPKVAQCELLYGLGQVNAFPIDVWVKRILEELYPNGMPNCTEGTLGIAQQYLFHWRRNSIEFK